MPNTELETLFAENGRVEYLNLDYALATHLQERGISGKHIVSFAEILEVHQNVPEYFENSPGRRAPAVMVGPTREGRFFCVPIEPTSTRGVWKPVTAYTANTHHIERHRRYRDERLR